MLPSALCCNVSDLDDVTVCAAARVRLPCLNILEIKVEIIKAKNIGNDFGTVDPCTHFKTSSVVCRNGH